MKNIKVLAFLSVIKLQNGEFEALIYCWILILQLYKRTLANASFELVYITILQLRINQYQLYMDNLIITTCN